MLPLNDGTVLPDPLRTTAHRAVYCLALAAIVAGSVSCAGTPRMTLAETEDSLPKETHVIAQFLRSEKNYNSDELTRLVAIEFMKRRQSEFTDYMLGIGASCQRTPTQTVCVYNHDTPYQMSRPWGFDAPAATIKGIATKVLTITATSSGGDALETIKTIKARIVHTAGATSIEPK